MRLAALLLAASCAWGQAPCILMRAAGQQVCVQPGNGMSLRGDLFALDVNVYTDPMFIKWSNDVSLNFAKLNSTSSQPFQPPVMVSQFTPQQGTDLLSMLTLFQQAGCAIAAQQFRQAPAISTASRTWTAALKTAISNRIDESASVVVWRNGQPQRNGYDYTLAAAVDRLSLIVTDATQQNVVAGTGWATTDSVLLLWIE